MVAAYGRALRVLSPQWPVMDGDEAVGPTWRYPVARAYLDAHAPQHQSRLLDLLDVWAAEMDHPERKREAETLRFGLRPQAA
jgi:hypothetical protein